MNGAKRPRIAVNYLSLVNALKKQALMSTIFTFTVVKCEILKKPSNISTMNPPSCLTEPTRYNHVCRSMCPPGYMGKAVFYCDKDGRWTQHGGDGSCKGKHLILTINSSIHDKYATTLLRVTMKHHRPAYNITDSIVLRPPKQELNDRIKLPQPIFAKAKRPPKMAEFRL